jgi:hypothetical protein
MPRLARKNIKVFAGSATNNGVFGSLQANNPTITSDVEQIQSLTAWGEGWNAATETSEELPPLEEIQGVEYVTTYQQAYIMQEGIPEWAATVTYYKGCLAKEVTSTGFRIYNSLTDNNTGNLLSDTSHWKKVMDSDDLYAFDSTVVHDTGNETISGTKTFSSTIAGSINGNAATVTNGVYTTGNQTIAGTKTFSASPIVPTPGNTDSSTKAATTAFVHNILVALYPVGSLYIGTQTTCPLTTLISGSTWELVAQDRALWGGDGSNANTTIAAGLPNITGNFGSGCLMNWQDSTTGGALYRGSSGGGQNAGGSEGGTNASINFDASRSNGIYGSSSTVQPPAYRVNVWRRTA